MDKNNIIGFVLIALVLIGFTWYQQPSAEEQRAAFVQDSIAQVTKAKAEKQAKLAEAARQKAIKQAIAEDTTSLFYNALRGQAESIVLKNEKIELTLNTKGATVEKAVIKGFDDYKGNKEITLFDGEDQKLSYTLSAKETNISTSLLRSSNGIQ